MSKAKREAVPVSDEYSDPAGESEMRRRAAWLLAMLAVVAVLVVTLMVVLLGGNSDKHVASPISPSNLFPTAPSSSSAASTAHSSAPTRQHTASPSTSAKSTPKPKPSHSVSTPPRSTTHSVNCPGSQPCVASGDIGNAVAAINSYRQQNGRRPVSGAVTKAAQTCALTNGSSCHGSWAESQVAVANGQQALHKVLPFAHGLLDSGLSSLQVGWAYDPGAKEFYFALIENG